MKIYVKMKELGPVGRTQIVVCGSATVATTSRIETGITRINLQEWQKHILFPFRNEKLRLCYATGIIFQFNKQCDFKTLVD